MIEKNKLRFVIGPTPNTDFKVYLGDQDISEQLMVKSFKTSLDANSGHTTVELELYSDQLEILADVVNVNVVNWPRRTFKGWVKNLWDSIMLRIGR